MKKLKTGDVMRFTDLLFVSKHDKWVILRDAGYVAGRETRNMARIDRFGDERIAKILKMTPKTVTVQISK